MAAVHGTELSKVIVDGGESAKSLNRPGIARLLASGPRWREGRHRGQAGPAHAQRQGPVRTAGEVSSATACPSIPARALAAGPEDHDRLEPIERMRDDGCDPAS